MSPLALSRIYKYPLELAEEQFVEMPAHAKILCVQWQGVCPVLWAQVDPNANKIRKRIRIMGTGYDAFFAGLQYIGTVQVPDAPLVWHVFDGGWA